MPEQEQNTMQEQLKNSTPQELYGNQGNTDQYGQGQYDSEGKPDIHGPQAQRIQPTQTQSSEDDKNSSNDQVPLQDLQKPQNA
ncbi:MAG: hypothetical protein NVSMB49_02660 [Ktedonobacteraceae bacterium]